MRGMNFGASEFALWSVTTASEVLLASWFVGQTLQFGIAGAVAGRGLAGERALKLLIRVVALVLLLAIATVTPQSLGLAPAVN